MSYETPKVINLRNLDYSPLENPLIEPKQIKTKHRLVRAARGTDLADPKTGEITHIAGIESIQEKDDEEFVKVFAAGVTATYELSKTAQRVFQTVLDQYQRTPMTGGYADSIDLFWFGNGIDGRNIGMSEKTFQRGLKELLTKQFLAPKNSASFWTNPALFFKGNRVRFIQEYRRKTKNSSLSLETT